MAEPTPKRLPGRLRATVPALVGMLCCVATAGWRDPFAVKVNEGNKLYHDGKYDPALSKYADAQANAPNAPSLFFNMGAAQYKKGKFDEAVKLFQRVSASPQADLLQRARANYNIGNCLVRNPGADIERYTRALDRYKTVLVLTLDSRGEPIAKSEKLREDAKFNCEWVQRKILQMMNRPLANQMPDYLAVVPSTPTVIVGEQMPVAAAGYRLGKNKKRDGVNDDGSPKEDDTGPIAIEAHWAANMPEAVGKIDEKSGLFTAGGQVGKGQVFVEDRTQGRFPLRAKAPLHVVLPDRLEVGPATVTVAAGSTAYFTTQAYTNGPDGIPDAVAAKIAAKQKVPSQGKAGKAQASAEPAFTGDDRGPLPIKVQWSIKSGQELGTIDAQQGVFTAGSQAGKVVVMAAPMHASSKGMSATAQINIVKPDYLRITPAAAPVPLAGQQQFAARAYSKGPNGKTDGVDPSGKPLGDDYGPLDVEVTWASDAAEDVGRVDAQSGLFLAGKTPGKAQITARATAKGVRLDDATAVAQVVAVDYIRVLPAQAKLGLTDVKQFAAHGFSSGPNGKVDGVDEKGQPKSDDVGPLPVTVKWSTDLLGDVAAINSSTGLLKSFKTPGRGSVFAATAGSGTILEASAQVQIEDKKKQKQKQKQKRKQKQKQKRQQRLSKKDAMKLLRMLEDEQRKRRRKQQVSSQPEYVEKDW